LPGGYRGRCIHRQQVSQQLNRDLAQNLVADRNLVEEGRLNQAAVKETFHQYMVINPSIEIYLLDNEGRILAYSADPGKVKRKHVSLAPIQAFLRGGDYPLLGDDPRSHDRQKAFSVTPVPSAEHPEGYLYVVLRGEQFDSVDTMIRDSYLDTALRHSERLTRLVSELFELAQLDARQTEPELEPLAVTDLVQDVVRKFSLRAQQRGIHLSIGLGTSTDGTPAEPLPLVLADIALTERVLENLIGNALDHTQENGQVRLSLYRRGDRVEVTVSDNGAGIAAEHLAHIFEPFYQAGNRHRGNQHAGLGLAIARRIVELQYGELRVSSEAGHGAAFTFFLPVAPGVTPRDRPPASGGP